MPVTKLTIGRLFNLGNYEHVRYEVTVEVQPNEPAEALFRGIETVMEALNPVKPQSVGDTTDLARMRQVIQRVQETPEYVDGELQDFGYSHELHRQQTKAEQLAVMEDEYFKFRAATIAWHERRRRALAALNDLGGAAEFTDAKLNWDEV